MFFGEELHDAQKRIGGVVALAGTVAAILIAIPIVLFSMSVNDLQGVLSADSPFAAFLKQTAGPRVGAIVSFGIATAIFNALVVSTVASSRFYYANARDGIFPQAINQALTRVHGRQLSPWIATLVLGGLGAVFCVMGERMNILLLSGENFSVALVAASVLLGRRLGRTGKVGYRTPWYPLVPIFGVIVTAGLIVATYADRDAGRPSMMILSGVVVVAAVYYQAVLRPRGWRVQVPTDAVPATQRPSRLRYKQLRVYRQQMGEEPV